ncbi:competence protein [Pontibacillus chungwhensis BH030062]|uniref:Competence protein n=1 Tax=Pontibacillus chungwhensis BH030062 TaxID=1385513 RepID=A0A0A2US74_9BACI|nr:competence protein ComK [Pontibacillus chungwhensis]KGP90779.1 competence protein [Pontibacillus chungwhensis BH030062]
MDMWKDRFEVSPFTQAILADERADGKIISLVMEGDESFYVNQSPKRMIDHACKYFGSSLKGRQAGTRDVTGITHKAPIAIDPMSGMYFFPTISPQNVYCSWVAHSHVDVIEATGHQQTRLVFKNQRSVIVDVSKGTIWNQIQRTAQFRYKLNERLQYVTKPSFDHVAESVVFHPKS